MCAVDWIDAMHAVDAMGAAAGWVWSASLPCHARVERINQSTHARPPSTTNTPTSFAADAEKPSARSLVNRMADLLLNSYFPQGQGVTGSKQVGGGGEGTGGGCQSINQSITSAGLHPFLQTTRRPDGRCPAA